MTENQNQNQDQDQAWQPDQPIVFNQDEKDEAGKAVKEKPAVDSDETYHLNGQQAAALQSLVNRLENGLADLKQIIQALGINNNLAVNIKDDGEEGSNIVEGYFDGEKMIAPDGKTYAVPANYASKSKLVEGDGLKLIIGSRGNFMYKQIGPIERQRLIAVLEQADDGSYYAVSEHQRWRLLKASVSYFRAQNGDKIAILVPEGVPANYAALENLVAE
ncbi:MAG TPA: hypothetical protein PKN62_01205 [bacterium]|nr:hypothetical protein [bacterium]